MANRSGVSALVICAAALLACKVLDKGKTDPGASSSPMAAPGASDSGEVSFVKSVPKAGSKFTAVRRTATKFTLNGKVYRETSVLDASFDVQGSDEFRIWKGSLDVKEMYTTKQEGNGSEQKSTSSLAGSRYVVTRSDDGKLSALDSNGQKLASNLVGQIKDEFAGVFEKNEVGAFLPDRAVKIGEKLTPSSDSVLRLLEMKDDGNTLMDGIEFFLRSVSGDRASFDVAMTMTQKIGSNMRLRAKLKGTMELKPNGTWLLGFDLKGPLTLLDGSGNDKGSGDLSATLTQTYN